MSLEPKAKSNKAAKRIRVRAAIWGYAVICLAFLVIYLYLSAPRTYDTSPPQWYNTIADIYWSTKGVQATLEYLDFTLPRPRDMPRYHMWVHLVDLGRKPANLDLLRQAASLDGLKGLYANMALFRLRDDPETRLTEILQRLESGTPAEYEVARHFLQWDLDRRADKQFEPLLQNWPRSADPDTREFLRQVIAHF